MAAPGFFVVAVVFALLWPAVVFIAEAASCACEQGYAPPAALDSLQAGNEYFLANIIEIRAAYHFGSDCARRMWLEAFILGAAWEGNHEALRRYTLGDSHAETYFVVPTYCAADGCLDHRVDWAKNALLDAQALMSVAYASTLAGKTHPKEWLVAEELVGNLQEIIIDKQNNDHNWIYCPTSYNPVAPWRAENNNMTWLPQLVWVDLPINFTDAADRLNCSLVHDVGMFASSAESQSHNSNATNKTCAESAALVSAAFGAAVDATNMLAEHLRTSMSADILSAFKSAPPPVGTLKGLRSELALARDPDFRSRATAIFDGLVGRSIIV